MSGSHSRQIACVVQRLHVVSSAGESQQSDVGWVRLRWFCAGNVSCWPASSTSTHVLPHRLHHATHLLETATEVGLLPLSCHWLSHWYQLDWLVGRLVGRSVGRSVGQLVDWSIDRLIDWSIDWFKVLDPTRHKIGHFRDILPSQSLGLVLKK